MAKRIDTNKLRIAVIGGVMFLFILIAALSMLLSGGNAAAAENYPELSYAPAEYAYPEYFTKMDLGGGYNWMINDSGQFILTTDDGKEYVVLPDGSVYEVGEDGKLIAVDDKDIISEVMDKAAEAAEDSDVASSYFNDNTLPLSDEAIKDLVGDDISADEFRQLEEAGLTPEQIKELLEQGYSFEDILNALNSGISPEDLESYLDQFSKLMSRLEESIAGTGMTVEDLLKMLEEMGITPEEYLTALDTVNSSPSPEPVPTPSANTNSLPSLTVSLGGNESTVIEKEEDYQSMIDNILSSGLDTSEIMNSINGITQKSDYVAQNDQQSKTEFMSSFSSNSGSDQLTKYDIAPGTVVTMILKTGINSDLPGQIVAEVTQNVYDSLTGTVLLIPKGTRLIATYSSSVSWGQERALVAWTQLIRPDGFMLNLPGLSGIDGQGYAGYHDKVNNHVWDLIWGAGLASLLNVGADEVSIGLEDSDLGALGMVLGGYTDTLTSAAQDWLKKVVNQQPTLTVRPGRTVKLLVTQKLTLRPYSL